jgi:hypothetical protein
MTGWHQLPLHVETFVRFDTTFEPPDLKRLRLIFANFDVEDQPRFTPLDCLICRLSRIPDF